MAKSIEKLKKNILAMELGSSAVKFAIGDFGKDGLTIRQTISTPLPDNVYSDGEVTNMEILKDTVRNILKDNKIKTRQCFCTVESSKVITREVTVPGQNKENLQDIAKYEVEQYMPVDMAHYVVQSIVIRELEIEDKPFAEMLVTAVPKIMVEEIHQLIEQVGLEPLVLDTHANTFAKLIENQDKVNGNVYHKEGTVAFVDLGNETISISIFSKGKFRFHRMMNGGGKMLDAAIAGSLSCSYEEARVKKMNIHNINYVVDDASEEAKVVRVVKHTFDRWLEDINKIFRYYNTRASGASTLERIYLYGGLANINGLTDYVESVVKLPTERMRKVSSIEMPAVSAVDMSELWNTLGVMYRRQVEP